MWIEPLNRYMIKLQGYVKIVFFTYVVNFQLKHYLKMRSSYPDLLTNLTASKLRTQLKEQLQTIYKSRDKHGRRIFIFRAGKFNSSFLEFL